MCIIVGYRASLILNKCMLSCSFICCRTADVIGMMLPTDASESVLALYRISRKDRQRDSSPTNTRSQPRLDINNRPVDSLKTSNHIQPIVLPTQGDEMNFYDIEGVRCQAGLSGVKSSSTLDLSTHKWKSWTGSGSNPLTTQQIVASESAHGM